MRRILPAPRITAFLAALLTAAISQAGEGAKNNGTAKEKWNVTNPFVHLVFIENKGQFDKKDGVENSSIRYGARRGDMQVYFTPSGLTYRMDEFSKDGEEEREAALEKVHDGGRPKSDKIKPHYVHLEWIGANPDAQVVAEDKNSYFFSYPDVNDPTYTRSFKADAYKKITYRNLYPGIDLEYIFPEKGGLKYSFILNPGADASLIKMKYTGEVNAALDVDGNVKLNSSFLGEFIDHAPVTVSESADNASIPTSFAESGNVVSFRLGNYDHNQKIIIDPWTTNPNFTSYNAAYDLEYDLNGNAYVYGGNWPWQEIKLNSAGVIQWVYNASLFYGSGCSGPCYGDFAVDGTSGSAYLVEGFNGGSGTRVIKVNAGGTQVAVFPGNNNLGEMWRIVYNNCAHKAVIAGGGISYNYQACVLDTNCTTMTPVNVLGATTALHDMNLVALDNNNMAYMATARSLSYPTVFNNSMLQAPGGTLSPVSWMVSDGYNFAEVSTIPYVNNITSDANGFNGMAVSPNFLYTYDGSVLKKWNKTNGTLVGSVTVIGTPYQWGGIDVDDCDNIYVGCQSSVKKYDVNLNNTATYSFANTVYDLKLGPNNTLFAAGKQFVAAQTLPNNVCNPLTLTITGAGNCSSGSATVTVTGGTGPYSYSWSTTPPQTTQTATGLSPGTYTVTVRDQSCVPKIQTDTITITNFSNLATTAAATSPLCSNGTGSATASPTGGSSPYTYSWSNGQTSQTATGLASGTYTVTVTDNAGCSTTASVSITVPPTITVSTSSTQPVCSSSNGTATASATGGTGTFTYSWSNGATTASISNLAPGNYTVTVTDGNGCTSSVVLVLTPTGQPPTVTISPTTNVLCNGGNNGSATANATGPNGPYTYSWSNGQTNAIASNLTANSYTVYVTDVNGCSSSQTVTITEPAPLAVTANKTDVSCNGGSNGSATCTVTGGTGPYSYSWSNSQTTSNASNLTAGNYTVTVTDVNGCTVQTSVSITQPLVLAASVAPPSNICPGACTALNSSASGGTSPYTYSWSSGLTGSSVQACPTVNTAYTVTVTDANGCTTTSSASVTLYPPVTVAFVGDTLSGCVPLCVNFTNNTSNSASCQWTFGDGGNSSTCNPGYCYNTPGAYNVSLTVTDANGCSNTLTMNNYVNVYALPVADFTMGPQPTTIYNSQICFTDNSTGAAQWMWYFGDSANSTSTSQNPCFIYRDTGTFCVKLAVANANNCPDTIVYCLVIEPEVSIFVPNAFTPNGDGFNDSFYPKGQEIDPDKFEMWIFDRWGNMIFHTQKWGEGWDGRANGGKEIAQEDVYVWKINCHDMNGGIHKLIGHVSLIK